MVLAVHRRRLSLFNRMVLWLHYAVMVCLVASVSAKYISPSLFWFEAFLGLAFPFLFMANMALIIFWLVQFKPAIFFGIVAALFALPTALRFVQVSFAGKSTENKILKVTSYNCMLFDLYNWYHDYETRPKIFSGLMEVNPDIICLQEFYTSEQKNDYNNIDTVIRRLNTPYYHCEYTTTLRKLDHWGIATFSKYPIINKGKIVFHTSSNNICIYSDIILNRDTVRIYNVHFQSVGFSKKDNKFLDDLVDEKDAQDELENSASILRRLKRAFIKRTQQMEMLKLHIKTCRYKIILCGDFNDTAASYTYEQLTKKLEDAFLEKGFGFGRTYVGRWPNFRIDYILHDKAFHCSGYKRSEQTFTDHFPITAFFDNINWRN